MNTEAAHPLSVRESFVRQIEARILSGELQPGDRLPTSRELCAQMGISLTVVNAGMAELVSKGFVEVKPRHGVYVADYKTQGSPAMLLAILQFNGGRLNGQDVRSFCETRMALDPLVAELAIARATEEQLRAWQALLEPLHQETDRKELCRKITEFFYQLYRMSDNFLVTMLFHSTREPQERMYEMFLEQNGPARVVQSAEDACRCVLARDVPAATRCLRETMRLPLEGPTAIV